MITTQFDDRFGFTDLASADDPLPAKKADRVIRVPVVQVPTTAVQTEHGMEALEAKAEANGETVKSETKPVERKRDARNICERHGNTKKV